MIVSFEGIESERVKTCFRDVLQHFPGLHDDPVLLKQQELKGSTMQAQPILSPYNLLSKHRAYRVRLSEYVRDSEIRVDGLPDDVLRGWFAHELGHLADFEDYTNLQMIVYGAKYVLSGKVKREAEYRADIIALERGFKEDIIAAKKFLLENELIDADYRDKIQEYYMTIEEVEMWQRTDRHIHVRGIIDFGGGARKRQMKQGDNT